MEKYSSGDVCERCRWQIQRAIRSGSGQNFAKRKQAKNFGHRNRTKRRAGAKPHYRAFLPKFNIFYGEVLKWPKRRDSKSRRA